MVVGLHDLDVVALHDRGGYPAAAPPASLGEGSPFGIVEDQFVLQSLFRAAFSAGV